MKEKNVESHISQILVALGSSEDVRAMTMDLVRMAEQYEILESRNTLGEAAGLVYIAGILTTNARTLAGIAECAGLSPETVRKYKTRLASELKPKKEWPGLPSKRK
jgi:transcription initiation factor TFIIIB Brf1 subunit/transcription initiation factor TFIIB